MSRNQMEDADQVIVVPDTPDRLAFQNASGGQCVEKNGNSPIICHLGDSPYPGERVLNQLKGTGRLVNENRHDERGNLCPRNNVQSLETENCNNSAVHSHEGSFPSTGAPFFRRMNTEKTSKHEPRYGVKCIGKVKPLCNKISTKSSACPKVNAGIPPDRQEGHTQILEQASVEPSDQETKNALLDAVTDLPLHPVQGSSRKYHNVSKWKGKKEDTQRGSMDREKGIKIVSADSPKTEGFVSPPFQSDTSQRVIGKKRLVRNGCISPQNIVKAKQLAEKKRTSVRDAGCSDAGNASLKGSLSITDSDSSKVKGKEVVVCPSPLNDDAVKIKHFPSRNKEANGTSHVNDEASTCFDEQGGWRNPRNHAKKPVIISSEKRCVYRRSNDSHNEDHNTGVAKRVGGTKNDRASLHYNQEARNTVSTPCRLSLSSKSAFSVDPVVTQQGIRDVANPLTKKQKHHGPVLSNGSECSTSGYNDSEFLVRESTWVSSTSRSNRNKRDHSWCIPNSYIQIDESSPEVRVTGSHNADSDVRSRQVEADEILALELQQHLYEETPLVGDSVTDAYIARALQHGEEAQIASSGGNNNMLRLGSLPIPPVTRRPRARSLENRPNRRATRVPALNRRERLRRRLLGQPRTMMSRVEGLQFPPNMGLDMRINILEALEAAVDDLSDISVPNHLFNAQREFNENDYEMLLALDEDNHQHGGATADQINALPQSTLQTDDFDEACAICLETPGVGEVIRHLPCLHKFHKHCIDPWLSRRTSCPVCKSSIT